MRRKLLIMGLLLSLARLGQGTATAQAVPLARFPIDAAVVAESLSAQGFSVDRSHIELPPGLTVLRPKPHLQITSADLLPHSGIRLRLSCTPATDCQPFFAKLQTASAAEDLQAFASQVSRTPASSAVAESPSAHVLAGSHVTLLLEDLHMRIVLPVVAIDSGYQGSEVRVSSLDRKQTFRAVVADGQTVRGALP